MVDVDTHTLESVMLWMLVDGYIYLSIGASIDAWDILCLFLLCVLV